LIAGSHLQTRNTITKLSGSVADTVTITNPGQGYAPSGVVVVTISGVTGSGATAQVDTLGFPDYEIRTITITAAGQNYDSVPTITITNPGGSGYGATAVCELAETQLTFLNSTQVNALTFPDMSGNVAVVNVSGTLSESTLYNPSLKIGRADPETFIDFSSTNHIYFTLNSSTKLTLNTQTLSPVVDGGLNLGRAADGWGDVFLASGSAIKWDNGTGAALTHTDNQLAFDSDIVPEVSGTYDLGSLLSTWDNIYTDDLRIDKFGGQVLLTADPSYVEAYYLIARERVTAGNVMVDNYVKIKGNMWNQQPL
jgi:hypothetical protein